MLNIRALDNLAGLGISEFRCRQVNGQPLPSWLDHASDRFMLGKRPVDVEQIDLTIEAVLEDGTIVRKDVRIDLHTGAIKSLGAERRADLPEIFSRQLKTQLYASAQDFEAIGLLLAS